MIQPHTGGSSGGTAARSPRGCPWPGEDTQARSACRPPVRICGFRPTTAATRDGVAPITSLFDQSAQARVVADLALFDAAVTGDSADRGASLRGLRLAWCALLFHGVDPRSGASLTR